MKNIFASLGLWFCAVGFHSFILFNIAKWSFFGMTFDHYIDSFLTLGVMPILVFACSWVYFTVFGDFAFARRKLVKFFVGFFISLLIFIAWDYFFKNVSFHPVTSCVWSLLLTCLFIDDPDSMRSLKRLKKEKKF